MLNIMISVCSEPLLMKLAEMIKISAPRNTYNMDVEFIALRPEKVLKKLQAGKKYLIIFEMQENHLDIYQTIRREFRDVYIVFIAGDPLAILPAIQMNVMPSGFILKPPVLNELKKLLTVVYNDYLNRWENPDDVLTINLGKDIYKINCNEIIYFEAQNKKVNIVTKNRQLDYYGQMHLLEEKLRGRFIRCHRGYLINAAKIQNIVFSEMQVFMSNGAKIPISRGLKGNLRELYAKQL